MRLSIIGTGHVGLVTAACYAHLGHEVLGIDSDRNKIDMIGRGEVPFQEPDLGDLVAEGIANGRLTFSTDPASAATHGPLSFICVGTPSKPSGQADLSYIQGVATAIAAGLSGYQLLAERSTVPVGTGDWLLTTLRVAAPTGSDFDVASTPEFLQEGTAVRDTLEPTRIVVGTRSDKATDLLREAYQPVLDRCSCPFIATDIATAEIVKHASNAFLATKISFINQIADVCEATGADVATVAAAMGMDERIAPGFLRAGLGYGGACLPKDVQAFLFRAGELGVDMPILEAADRVNRARRTRFVERIVTTLGGSVEGKRIAVWGLAFKPDTDDLRQAPALDICTELSALGATVVTYDPAVMPQAKELLPAAEFATDPYDAVAGADILAICTDWAEFAAVDLARVHDAMATPAIIDGRNMYDSAQMHEHGFTYVTIGRS